MKLIFIAVLLAISAHFGAAFSPIRARRSVLQRTSIRATDEMEETDEEIRDRLRKKMRKNMYSPDGVAYAPWVTKQIDEEAILDELVRQEKDAGKKKTKTSTLDRGEIETAEGMQWRMNQNQVELAWITGTESENLGYIVEKRPSYGGDFQEVASFKEVSGLVSKGASGGRYRYLDPSTSSGSWIYRVSDCDDSGEMNTLCQCFVEVETESETKAQSAVAVGFVAILAAAAAAGYALDPPL